MTYELFVLRLIHVLGGIFWVGAALFMTWYLMPEMSGNPQAAGVVLGGLQRRNLMTVLPVVALLTILSGLRLIMLASGGFEMAYFHTPTGATFATAGTLAIIAFLMGVLVARPAAMRAAKLGAKLEGASPAEREAFSSELARLRARNATTMSVVAVLLVLGAAGMAIARYL